MRDKLYELLRCNVCESPSCAECQYDGDDDGCISYMEYRMADHLIANGVAVQEWIPVTERLPEHGKVCLICARYNEMFIRQWDAVVKMWIGDAYQYDFPVSAVTHWMPRPVPPKEGEG